MPVLLEERRTAAVITEKKRVELLDLLRGISMIYVMIYHLAYDLVFIADIPVPFWGSAWFEAVHNVILAVLFSVSGICTAFSRDPVKRGAAIFFMGELLTFFTDLFMPDELIVFGVLSYFGVMMMLTGLLRPLLQKTDLWPLCILFVLLYIMFFDFARGRGTVHLFFTDLRIPLPSDRQNLYPLGIMHSGFYSADYFPIIPYGFIYLAGAMLSKRVKERRLPEIFYADAKLQPLNFIGKHSLIFYIVHQPVFLGITFLIANMKGDI